MIFRELVRWLGCDWDSRGGWKRIQPLMNADEDLGLTASARRGSEEGYGAVTELGVCARCLQTEKIPDPGTARNFWYSLSDVDPFGNCRLRGLRGRKVLR